MDATAGATAAAIGDHLAHRYGELRRLARRFLQREAKGHTLQPTALVHEAWLRLARQPRRQTLPLDDFLGAVAGAMRLVLVDHARARRCVKRGGEQQRVAFAAHEAAPHRDEPGVDALMIHEALGRLARLDAGLAHLVELRCFAGLCEEAIAARLAISPRTVRRQWRVAKLFLAGALGERPPPP